jgi:hypothetical protein
MTTATVRNTATTLVSIGIFLVLVQSATSPTETNVQLAKSLDQQLTSCVEPAKMNHSLLERMVGCAPIF